MVPKSIHHTLLETQPGGASAKKLNGRGEKKGGICRIKQSQTQFISLTTISTGIANHSQRSSLVPVSASKLLVLNGGKPD